MPNLSLSPLRRSIALATIIGVAAVAPTAVAAPAKKSKAAKRQASADLIVRDLEVEVTDDALEISADVANVGNKRANKRTDYVVAISADETLDDEDSIVDEGNVRKLRPGKVADVDTDIDIPAEEDLPEGDVYLLVCADGYDVLREKNEANNCSAELIASATDEEAGSGDEGDDDVEVVSEDDETVVEESA